MPPSPGGSLVESDPTRINELLVGLGAVVEVVSVGDEPGQPLRVLVRLRSPRPVCGSCGGSVGRAASGVWSWWTWGRSGGRCGWCWQSAAGGAEWGLRGGDVY